MNNPNFTCLQFEVRDVRCRGCGQPISIPMRSEYSDPVYVAHVELENVVLMKEINHAHEVLMELAGECVEAGVKPAFLRRADELKELLDLLLKRHGRGAN